MLDFLKGKRKGNCIGSPCKGKAVALTEVPDPTFSEKIVGDGLAVIPSEGKIYGPADGEVTVVFETLHAITMTTDQGAELLSHIGLDTVTLKGCLLYTSIMVLIPMVYACFGTSSADAKNLLSSIVDSVTGFIARSSAGIQRVDSLLWRCRGCLLYTSTSVFMKKAMSSTSNLGFPLRKHR